jgi:uncharacterized BrkB/YihY/UPF0761 family membrane protein
MNAVWSVPPKEQPGFVGKLIRASLMLLDLGEFILGGAVLAWVGTIAVDLGMANRILSLGGSVALNVALFAAVYSVLTAARLRIRDVLPGAVLAGLFVSGMQTVGSVLINGRLQRAEALYGFFGLVLGLLAYMYLAAQVTVIGAEVNVVLRRRLWPRSLREEPSGEPDDEAGGPPPDAAG